MKAYVLISFLFFVLFAEGQETISGVVRGTDGDKNQTALPGANVYWHNTDLGTITNDKGRFELAKHPDTDTLVVSFIGYLSQMFIVRTNEPIKVELFEDDRTIGTVDVVEERASTEIKLLLPTNTQIMNTKELRKAACCSLSESFETNPAIDVSFTDAVTGTRQIKMLGLDGKYTMITQDNLPSIRGFSVVYGIEMIPGAWIESIHVSKGAGSVVNGYESMTGQINVGMWRPENAPKFHLNLFASGNSRLEANAHYRHKINDKWSTIVFGHLRNQAIAIDRNKDNFIDVPMTSHAIFRNEWNFRNNKMESQFGVNYSYSRTRGGEMDYDFNAALDQGKWGAQIRYERFEAFLKTGYFIPSSDFNSIGLQVFYAQANSETFFGGVPNADFPQQLGNLHTYDGDNTSFNANLIYMAEFAPESRHTYKTGLSYTYDFISDDMKDVRSTLYEDVNDYNQDRTESVVGAFYEYAYNKLETISFVAGLRYDQHNSYGGIFSPRMHLRYSFDENHVIKLSAGRGFRTANVFMENLGLFANSRVWLLNDTEHGEYDPSSFNFGLDPEIAWNFGLSLTKRFTLDYRDGFISVDAYHTRFENQVVIDMDNNSRIYAYNLLGESFSNSIQAEVSYEVIRRLDVKAAYRYLNVQTTQITGLTEKPFNAPHRWFLNTAYQTRKREGKSYWLFDLTYQFIGTQRIPGGIYGVGEKYGRSPSYSLLNGQVTLLTPNSTEWYLGFENLFNYRQSNPILSAENPFSSDFDASLIWGPVFGRMLYAGMRWTIE